jgi:YD repeat-containing protein
MDSRTIPKWCFYIGLVASLAFLPGSAGKHQDHKAKQGPMKFRGLDRNNDGRITPDEWRGNAHSFSVHDRNADGVLTGAEVGAALQEERYVEFSDLDLNRDGRVFRDEWRWDRAEFDRIDADDSEWLSRSEYMDTVEANPYVHFSEQSAAESIHGIALATSLPEAPGDHFVRLDRNGNGRLSRKEWPGDQQSFNRIDSNDDDRILQKEFIKRHDELEQNFLAMDRDHDGWLSRNEWRGESRMFERLDDNNDARISRVEFVGLIRG